MPNELIRSFVAVDLNDDSVLHNITETQQALLRTGTDLKLVEPQNIHITLRFLGEIRRERVEEVVEQMKQIQFPQFRASFRGLGVFPSLHRPTVVWIGIVEGADKLSRISQHLERGLTAIGFQSDRRGFTPHLTIARVRSGRNRTELVQLVSDLQDKEFGSINVESIRLKKSTLTPNGPIYSDLYKREGTST